MYRWVEKHISGCNIRETSIFFVCVELTMESRHSSKHFLFGGILLDRQGS